MVIKCLIYIVIAIIILFVEICLLNIWFTRIYLYEKRLSFSQFKGHVKQFYDYKNKYYKNQIIASDSMIKFLEEKKYKYENFESILTSLCIGLIIYAITGSLFFVPFLLSKSKYVNWFSLFVLVIEVLLFRDLCYKFSKSVIKCLDEFNLFLYNFRIKLKNEKISEINQQNQKSDAKVTWGTLIISIVIVIGCLLFMKKLEHSKLPIQFIKDSKSIFNIDYKQNPTLIAILISIIFILIILLYFIKKKIFTSTKGIVYDKKFTSWENDIKLICKKLQIKNVEIKVTYDIINETVSSCLKKDAVPQIRFCGYFWNDLEDHFKDDSFYYIVLFILGHELSHISSKDSLNEVKSYFYQFLIVCFFIFLWIYRELNIVFYTLVSRQPVFNIINLTMIGFMSCIYFLFYKTWSDERYWKQVCELRADRIGLQLSNISIDLFKKFMAYSQNEIETEEDFHPLYETRIREMEKYQNMKWKVKDYLRYTWEFAWNLRIHKEWRL